MSRHDVIYHGSKLELYKWFRIVFVCFMLKYSLIFLSAQFWKGAHQLRNFGNYVFMVYNGLFYYAVPDHVSTY